LTEPVQPDNKEELKMDRRAFVAGLLGITGAPAAWASLEEFVRKAEPELKWSKQNESQVGEVKVVNLKVRSQVWRGIPWDHTVQVFLPKKISHPKTGLLLITGGNPGDTTLGAIVASRLEAPAAILYNIPNQPLFNGKSEDDLIAHTFEEYLKSGDDSWILLFPMVKSARAAMDALQDVSEKEWGAKLEDFVVTGASKRGWTTWLTAAADKRVRAIAPMVFDNLNFNRQMPRQLELWGKYSEQIDDYTRRGLQQKMETEAGKKLVSLVDPWFYRKQLTMPKLLINGANDRYWATDATRIYWDDLAGKKHLLSIPNVGHGVQADPVRLINSIAAFFHAQAGGKPFPELTFEHKQENGKAVLRVQSTVEAKQVGLWIAKAPDLDFRPVKWEAAPMQSNQGVHLGDVAVPATGGVSVFAEASYELDGKPFTLSTPSAVYGSRPGA
jgi:PhoPQ-activated pathogenicity-related protein